VTRTILICSGKGGVGKTTLTANLGIALARLGQRTAVLDADFGLRNLDLLLGLENRIIYTAQEVLAGSCRLEQALVKHKQQPNLALLPAGNPRMLDWLKPEDMQRIVALVAEQFDLVLIDCPAGIEDGFKNAMAAAREAIVITTPEVSAVRDADRVIGLLNSQGIQPIQLVLNRVRPKMMANQEMLAVDDVTEILALPLLGLVLEDEQVIVSSNRGEPLTLNGTQSDGSAVRRSRCSIRPRCAMACGPSWAASSIPRSSEPMALRDFINKLLGRQPASATTARQRLQLVLAHDRSDLNPELLEQMRREILEVVSRYVEIDLEEGDVTLETEDRVTALVANLPIKRARALPRTAAVTGS
jgi:septum site-determining protein MinD